ncbi:hypothetical protein KQI61_00100 [Anaerocolumna aminovalerica]|uniref:hypothetical protein n=1 Tax=Anaerocolumna aminovalerica TaxID=1527 RepID=UPI001C0EF522|nr:hypothetical protein [Anaerocolumna aminovalerica]MBU5330585.1 hypothetical protein [Anaerocolumna aminovalerica]
MKTQLIRIAAAFISGSLIMILHEFPKAILFYIINPSKDKKDKNIIFKLHHYIDPIGIIFCITSMAGFSKPFMYRIKDKKTNFILGIAGFASLALTFIISVLILRFGIGMNSDFTYAANIGTTDLILQYIMVYMALLSISMFIVNLFPVSTFDMGLCIAGKSPNKFFSIIRNDYLIKMILFFAMILQIIANISTTILRMLLWRGNI